jgi:hypothetical protein
MLMLIAVARLRITIQENSFTTLVASPSSLSRVVLILTVFIINAVLPAYTIKVITASSYTTTT